MLHAVADRAAVYPASRRLKFGAQVARPRAGLPTLMLQGLTRTFAGGATTYAQEDAAEFVYQVASGMVRWTSTGLRGRCSDRAAKPGRRARRIIAELQLHITLDVAVGPQKPVHRRSPPAVGE